MGERQLIFIMACDGKQVHEVSPSESAATDGYGQSSLRLCERRFAFTDDWRESPRLSVAAYGRESSCSAWHVCGRWP